MKRRAFIRLAGGGVVMAGAGWLANSTLGAIPARATAAWAPPPVQQDIRLWALSYALLAPNPHNLQPWMADLSTPGEILLDLDPARRLPATDPHGRQIMMGAGAFLELLRIAAAARGHSTQIQLFPMGAPGATLDGKPFARLRLVHDPATPLDPLFNWVLRRRTERGAYAPDQPVAASDIQSLGRSIAHLPVNFGVEFERLPQIRTIVREAWRIEMTTERTFMESMRLMRIGGAEIDRFRDGISIADPLLVAAAKMNLLDRQHYPGAQSVTVQSQLERFHALTTSTPAYLWITTKGNSRTAQIQAGRAYARINLAGASLGLAMHPNEQALQEYPEMAGPYQALHQLLGGPDHTVQMLARLGRLPEGVAAAEPAPRRGLAAQLRG